MKSKKIQMKTVIQRVAHFGKIRKEKEAASQFYQRISTKRIIKEPTKVMVVKDATKEINIFTKNSLGDTERFLVISSRDKCKLNFFLFLYNQLEQSVY